MEYMVVDGRHSIQKMILNFNHVILRFAGRVLLYREMFIPDINLYYGLTAWRRLATVERLLKIGIKVPPECVYCNEGEETFDHLYFTCPVTGSMWSRMLNWLGCPRTMGNWQDELTWANKCARIKENRTRCNY